MIPSLALADSSSSEHRSEQQEATRSWGELRGAKQAAGKDAEALRRPVRSPLLHLGQSRRGQSDLHSTEPARFAPFAPFAPCLERMRRGARSRRSDWEGTWARC